jgi:hypothetical protein
MKFTPSSSQLVFINDSNHLIDLTPKAPKIVYKPDYKVDYSLFDNIIEDFSLDDSSDNQLNSSYKYISNKADINELIIPKSYSIIQFLNIKS